MLQLSQQWGSPNCSPVSTQARTRPPLHQRRRWEDADDISVEPKRLSLDHLITIFPSRHDQSKSESDLSIKNWAINSHEGVEIPPSPSSVCESDLSIKKYWTINSREGVEIPPSPSSVCESDLSIKKYWTINSHEGVEIPPSPSSACESDLSIKKYWTINSHGGVEIPPSPSLVCESDLSIKKYWTINSHEGVEIPPSPSPVCKSHLSIKKYWTINSHEGVEIPPSPSPVCSPLDTSCSTHYTPPRHCISRSICSQYLDQFTRSRTIHEKSVLQHENPEGFYRRKGYDMTARSSGPSSWSGYNALFDLEETKPILPRTKAADEVEELHRSKLRSHHVFSVRRAKHPRKSSSEYSLATVQSTQSENVASSVTISQEVEQSDPDIRSKCVRDANAHGSCIQPKTLFQGFEPSTPSQNINLPKVKEEESASKSKGTLEEEESGNGSTSSEWDEGSPNEEAGSKIVTTGMAEREVRSSSRRRCLHNSLKLMTMGIESKGDEIKIRTIAWQEAKTAKVLNRLKREESLIVAWESKQRAKADIHMTKVERKLEEKRVKEWEKTQNKIARAHRKAEQRKAVQRAKINAETSRVTAIVDKIRSTGKLPWKFHFF